ncbi:Polysaccharide biosynthesis/export protein [Rubripirellula lacrimiformis]|uniref:Polysaccharide biosynthesis/export protein n=1 Tax=Rubripirellula lacrimiformis TaxID=1930273 RepID=A0A517N7T2_9BACT|nr:polysaccharide biosynthesis/export family protein [Rubripirellula lacrimiformis]QDT03194.1 Polysaccharide biosynthesis/export protein [Rubripirellula lacrimiformis]
MKTKIPAVERTRRLIRSATTAVAASLVATALSGCSALTQPINGVPADRLPPQFFAEPKNDLVPVDIALLSIEPPRNYQISGGDILGIYVEGVLPFNPPNQPPEPPPVNFPDAESTLPPSIGYPIAVQDDGTLSLPLVEPLDVEGLTLEQVRDAIRDKYIDEDILRPEKVRPIVTIIKERTYDVIVVREDGGGTGNGSLSTQNVAAQFFSGGSDRSASGGLVKLPAYQNDILHALVETGGLPGLNAKNEVKVLRANRADQRMRAQFMQQWYAQQQAAKLDPCSCPPPLPEDPSILRIPLRVKPGVVPNIPEDQIVLNDGDIVYIESRETEVYYTGGLLNGGEFPLPRDYDLDVLGAISIAGSSVGGTASQFGTSIGRGVQGVPPGMLYILRKDDCGGQVAIEVDLSAAINDPRQRPLVKAGDTLILQYKCEEEAINFGLSTFFTFGIAEIFRQAR